MKTLHDLDKITWSNQTDVIYFMGGAVCGEADAYDEVVLKFTDTNVVGILTVTSGVKVSVRSLIVGGGGAGGTSTSTTAGAGGGGGAGGFIDQTQTIEAGTYTITVGAGGTAATSTATATRGGDGKDSSFIGGAVSITAKGGGGGGAQSVGNPGGSGGGGSRSSANCNGGEGTSEQGNSGGKGTKSELGGGGGGAGGNGGNTSSSRGAGAGGNGKSSDIICDADGNAIYYAGGGAGGSTSSDYSSPSKGKGGGGAGGTSDDDAEPGVDGLGGGGGGGGATSPGGKGGDGVVILRIRDLLISPPDYVELEWNGEEQIGYEPKNYYEFVGGTTSATNAGTYTYQIRPAGDFEWKDWTVSSKETKTNEWKIAALQVEIPTSIVITYDGAVHEVASSDEIYEIVDGNAIATNAGEYYYTLRLCDTANTVWTDGTTADKTTTWSIVSKQVEKPTSVEGLVYSGTNSIVFTKYEGVVYKEGLTNSVNAGYFHYTVALDNPAGYTNYVWIGESGDASVANVRIDWMIAPYKVDVPVARTGLVYDGSPQNAFEWLDWSHYSLVTNVPNSTTNATLGGSYEAVFHLSGNDEAKNFVWNVVSETSANYKVPWSIGADTNEIYELKLVGWRIGAEAKTPTISAKWGIEPVNTVEYSYGFGDDAESVTSWTNDTDAITTPGTWVLRAVIPEDPSWAAVTGTTTFVMWDDPGILYHNWTEISIKGTTTALTNFVVPVRISEELMQGFYYENADSSKLVFVDKFGNLLSYDVDTWDESGESVVWLKLPTLPTEGMTVTNYWNLREGQTPPENTSTNVWSDYAGVWHLGGGSSKTPGTEATKDSTGNAAAATVGSNSSGISGVVGGALDSTSNSGGPILKIPASDAVNDLTNAAFTASFWARVDNNDSGQTGWPVLFARRSTHGTGGYGYGVRVASDTINQTAGTTIRVYAGGSSGYYTWYTDKRIAGGKWQRHDVMFKPGRVEWYIDGEMRGEDYSGLSAWTYYGYISLGGWGEGSDSLVGAVDEFRMRSGEIDTTLIAAEYKYQSDSTMITNDVVYLDGLKVDYWLKKPALKYPQMLSWDIDDSMNVDADGNVITNDIATIGELRYGEVTNYIYSVYNESEVYSAISEITNGGTYRAVFARVPTEGFQPLETNIEFRITKSKPYTKISGKDGDSGRILLMNDHDNKTCKVLNQGYDVTGKSTGTFWQRIKKEEFNTEFNLKPYTEAILWTKSYSAKLWHIVDCRHGNTYKAGSGKSQVFLPYSSESDAFDNSGVELADATTAGQVVMRNIVDATVYSPCYTNGIGTIYFDAVNGWAENTDNYKIVVEYATNTVEDLEPTDANCVLIDTNIINEVTKVTTNYYGKLEGCWRAAEMIPFMRDTADGTGPFDRLNETNELALAVTNGGTTSNFYRVAVPLDYHKSIRFRIRRTSNDSKWEDPDVYALILLDNIIASVPAMGGKLESRGHFEKSKTGREVLGWELATSVPYPSIYDGEIYGGAKPSFFINAGDGKTTWNTNDFFQSATLHYRWRYLNQKVDESWSTIELNPYNSFKALSKFELPGRACDVEYWYDYRLQAPYYEYVDYSGIGKQIDYTEERGMQTNRLSGAKLASAGTDWFFRVREGKSDYSGLDIVFRRGASAAPEKPVHMVAVGNHVWRGFLQTKENQGGEILYRIEALDEQTAEFAKYAATTNYWRCRTDNPRFPVTDSLEPGTADSWSKLTLDAVTGYVMFQIEDASKDSMSLTIVHADYQDVNGWSDALGRKDSLGRGPIFVGTSTTNAYKIGVSPKKQKFNDDFSGWGNMAATNEAWTFPVSLYTDINHLYGGKAYQTFTAETNGFWHVGQGMWVAKKYMVATNNAGVGLQMEGNGKGYFQFYDEENAPRGLESLSFNARLGQFVRFDDFAYYYAGNILNISNYTFMARTAFDLNSNDGFEGNASLSMVANYLPNKGCYEARWEWIGKENSDDKGGQRLCLYRWNVTSSGSKSADLIVARTNLTNKTNTPFDVGELTALTNSNSQLFMPMFISVSNAVDKTYVVAAVRRSGATLGTSPLKNGTGYNISEDKYKWFGVCFCDDTPQRLTRGSYGVLSANCDGVFARPEFSHTVQHVSNLKTDSFELQQLAQIDDLQDIKNCAEDDLQSSEYPGWNIIPGRLTNVWTSASINAVMSSPIEQYLQIYLGSAGRTDWGSTPYTNIALKGFGGSGFTLPLYTTKNCSVKFAVAGKIEDVRTDIVIDSVVMKQWRGGDWNGEDVYNEYIWPSWVDTSNRGGEMAPIYTNFVFTSCWTKDHNILMSAKRSNLETPCAIRSPIMDGKANNGFGGDGYARGIGLGMISIAYENAQSNTWLKLQVATNGVVYSDADTFDKSFSDRSWDTITNFNFAVEPLSSQLDSGVLNTYLGFHSVTGMMRIVVATNVIADVANTTDPQAFGEVTITSISCSDEPPVDIHSWWGWNMRTIGGDGDTEGKMFLSDYSTQAGGLGLSLALNNSVDEDYNISRIDVSDRLSYIQHKPFVQTPTFTSNIVGEVSFKARKYAPEDPHATVTMYGSRNASENEEGTWEQIAAFMVTNAWYETYGCKIDPKYKAFRLAVAGVEDVIESNNDPPPGASIPPPRVLLDEMFVSEAVNAIMGFKNVGCFRGDPVLGTSLSSKNAIPDNLIMSKLMQPICNEAWGVQCEIYGAQLASDIDFSRKPRVRLHWYEGSSPWGYEQWKNKSSANSVLLTRAESEEDRYIYRSTMSSDPVSTISMSTVAPTYVQYMLEVVYYTKENPNVASTNWLSSAGWTVPEWYRPVDLNVEYGKGRADEFSAYTILDNVAPGWAWINEVNIFGEYKNWRNTDENCQFVEIAHPPEADISGWTVRLLEPQKGNNLVITNVLATFGSGGLSGTKKLANEDVEVNMVFRAIANKLTPSSGKIEAAGGEIDAVWKVDNPTQVFSSDGVINYYDPMVFQLVRKSGIVEHEIIVEGTNLLESLEVESPDYIKEMRDFIASKQPKSAIVIPGYDYGGADKSLGVIKNSGHNGMEEPENDWTCTATMTPGHHNIGQVIDANHPLPGGEEVLVYFSVTGDHILQSLDNITFTNGLFTAVVRKNSPGGTNVYYRVDPWYVLGSVTTGNVSILDNVTRVGDRQPYEYKLDRVAQGISNTVAVIASAAVNPRLGTDWGIPENDPYRDAIINWLEGGRSFRGTWDDVESGEIYLAEFRGLSGTVVTNLTLKEMYWLDMDPTVSNLTLVGGMADAPSGVEREMTWTTGMSTLTLTNRRVTVYMMITNRTEDSSSMHYGEAWTPYVLRGRAVGSDSRNFDPLAPGTWNGPLFKIEGIILNGLTSFDNLKQRVPLRLFVFNENSFDAAGNTKIEIYDPHSPLSYGYQSGWSSWFARPGGGDTPVGFFWVLDERRLPVGVEQLKETNYYGE